MELSLPSYGGVDDCQRESKRVKLVRDVIRDVVGLMPYEKRILDVIKTAGASSEKKVYKFAKRRVRAAAG